MPPSVCLDDFALVKVLGKGSYGKVMLVKHNKDSAVYAMKMLRKENVIKRNQQEHTKTERAVLEAVSHPFIVNLHYAFQTPKKLYMVMDRFGWPTLQWFARSHVDHSVVVCVAGLAARCPLPVW